MNKYNDPDLAADLIRAKLHRLYSEEPKAKEELAEAKAASHRSKHQQYMYNISRSMPSLSDVQTAWHNYYVNLPDHEKHEVWREFYREMGRQRFSQAQQPKHAQKPAKYQGHPPKTAVQLKKHLANRVRTQAGKESSKHHLKSVAFGLFCGLVALSIFLFSFWNERFIAPFITPSKSISNTPIIIDPSSTKVSNDPIIVIPKINVEIPVVYDEPSIEEKPLQKALERGVVHYSTTPNPGEKGNTVVFGHSSNNIFNSGKYKFAFVLLKNLEPGDTFMLHKDGTRYVYKVFDKKVVSPTDLSVLDSPSDKVATASLITCDPPGTSINRLVVMGEQITPDPTGNTESIALDPVGDTTAILPSNAPSLWSKLWDWLTR